MGTHYPIRTGAAPAGNPHDYGDVDAIRALLDATDPGTIKAAGDAYRAASQNIDGLKALLIRASRVLSEVWEDEAATTAQRTLGKLQTSAENLATATRQIGTALDWHGGEILPWYVAHKPGAGWIKDDGDDEYAREYMQRLNTRIAEAWTRLPTSVTAEPVNLKLGTPEGFVTEARAAGNRHTPGALGGGSSGGGEKPGGYDLAGGRRQHSGNEPAQAALPSGQANAGDGTGTHLTGGPGGSSNGDFGSGGTHLAGLDSAHSGNPQTGYGNAGGRPVPGLAQSPHLGGSAPLPGIGGAAGPLGPSGPRPAPLPGPASTTGGRPGALPGRGGVSSGFPVGAQGANGASGNAGRANARSMPFSPMSGAGAGGGGRQEEDRSREYWLAEDREFWDSEDTVASVIGASQPVSEGPNQVVIPLTESAEVWGADSTAAAHIIGSPAPRSSGAEPQREQETPRSCGCDCGGNADTEKPGEAKKERLQRPPSRLEASSILRGE